MNIAILGAGGHAKVVCDAVSAAGEHRIIGVYDDNPVLWGTSLMGFFPILGAIKLWNGCSAEAFVIGIGENRIRKRLFDELSLAGASFVSVIHPKAVIASDVRIGDGTVVFANVAINTGATVGANVILNTSCSVDHDTTIDAHAHVAPGVRLAGSVRVCEGALLGIGACVVPGVKIGQWATVGAGAAVVHDVQAGSIVVGVPARNLRGVSLDP